MHIENSVIEQAQQLRRDIRTLENKITDLGAGLPKTVKKQVKEISDCKPDINPIKIKNIHEIIDSIKKIKEDIEVFNWCKKTQELKDFYNMDLISNSFGFDVMWECKQVIREIPAIPENLLIYKKILYGETYELNGYVDITWTDFINNSLESRAIPKFYTKTGKELNLRWVRFNLSQDNSYILKAKREFVSFITELHSNCTESIADTNLLKTLFLNGLQAYLFLCDPITAAILRNYRWSFVNVEMSKITLMDILDDTNKAFQVINIEHGGSWEMKTLLDTGAINKERLIGLNCEYLESRRMFSGALNDIIIRV